jgi:hypothetical protein
VGYSKRDKVDTHTRIVSVAANRFRKLGLEGIDVADVMQEAVLLSVVFTNISVRAINYSLRRWQPHFKCSTAGRNTLIR